MLSIKPMLLSLALCIGMAGLNPSMASAQGTKVIVIDSAKIVRDSKVGTDIRTKLQSIENGMRTELQPTADALTTELKTLEARYGAMTPEARRTDVSLRTELENYSRKENEFKRQNQIMSQELALTRQKAWVDFRVALNPVLQEVINEQSADLMIDRANAVYAGQTIDVTSFVISKLDAATPTVSVVRQKLPAQPAAAQ